MSTLPWRDGNRVELLENGEEFYPRVFAALKEARREVVIETFILFDDPVGRELQKVLIAIAKRGVSVDLTVDGYGTADLSREFVTAMTDAGVRLHVFDPQPRRLGYRVNIFRRLHRKIVVIDGRLAFTGGLNFSHDHLRDYGPEGKQDYAVEVEGPVVADIHAFALDALRKPPRWWQRRAYSAPLGAQPRAGDVSALWVWRDNHRRTKDIEREYRAALQAARREVIIANAYFFPGYRLLRDLRGAARRGVEVKLILQGYPDMPIVRWVGMTLYDYLLRAGVKIYEYCERPLHGKVAVVDGDWATVGSSNLDPLSLALNLEANLVMRGAGFAATLRKSLMRLVKDHCTDIGADRYPRRTIWRQALSFIAFHVARTIPYWPGWVPGHGRPVIPVTVPKGEGLPAVPEAKAMAAAPEPADRKRAAA